MYVYIYVYILYICIIIIIGKCKSCLSVCPSIYPSPIHALSVYSFIYPRFSFPFSSSLIGNYSKVR